MNFDIGTGLSLLTSLLPGGPVFAFAHYAPVAWKAIALVSHVDANNDGTVTGPEKLELARKEFILACAAIPALQHFCGDPAKVERVLNLAVEMLNELTNHGVAPEGPIVPATLVAAKAEQQAHSEAQAGSAVSQGGAAVSQGGAAQASDAATLRDAAAQSGHLVAQQQALEATLRAASPINDISDISGT